MTRSRVVVVLAGQADPARMEKMAKMPMKRIAVALTMKPIRKSPVRTAKMAVMVAAVIKATTAAVMMVPVAIRAARLAVVTVP